MDPTTENKGDEQHGSHQTNFGAHYFAILLRHFSCKLISYVINSLQHVYISKKRIWM
jgi:hypothetical protein